MTLTQPARPRARRERYGIRECTVVNLAAWLDEHPHLRDTDAYERVATRAAALQAARPATSGDVA